MLNGLETTFMIKHMSRIAKTTYKLQANGNDKNSNSSIKYLFGKGYISLKFCQLRSFNQNNKRFFDHSYIFFYLNTDNPELDALQSELLDLEICQFYYKRILALNRHNNFRGFHVADPTKNLASDKEKYKIQIKPPNIQRITLLREEIKNKLKCSKLRHSYNKQYLILLNIYKRQYGLELTLPRPLSAACLRKKIEKTRIIMFEKAENRRLERLKYYRRQIIHRNLKSRQSSRKQQIKRFKENSDHSDFFILCKEFLDAIGHVNDIPDDSVFTFFSKFSYETLLNGINYLISRKNLDLLQPIQNPFAYMYRIFCENVAAIPKSYYQNKAYAIQMDDLYPFVTSHQDYVTVGNVDYSYSLPPENFCNELKLKINFYLNSKSRFFSDASHDEDSDFEQRQIYYSIINNLKEESYTDA